MPMDEENPLKEGYHLRNRYLTTISSSNVRTVADSTDLPLIITSTADGFPVVPTSMILNDLKPQNRGFSIFLAILGCYTFQE